MQKLSQQALVELTKRDKHLVTVVEFYPRKVGDIAEIGAPAYAFGRFSDVCFDWNNREGSFRYEAKVLEIPEISTYQDERVNTAEVKFGNAKRENGSMARFILDNQIKGSWMVIRLIAPNNPNESQILFWGKCKRPGTIDSESIVIGAEQDLGNFTQHIPFREYQPNCPLEFGRLGGGCLGDQTLDQKSVSYRQRFAEFGTAACNKLFSTCVLLDNTRYFQGQRVIAVSGQFQYVTIEEVVKRVLFFTKRKKVPTIHNDTWSSVNQSEGSEVVPIPFGRCQIQGHPITWADQGDHVLSIQGFCEGKISAFTFIRCRVEGIGITSVTEHLGDWGGVGTQSLDTLFNGGSGYNSRLAYLEISTNGSSPTQVDSAPLVTAVIRGLEIPVPDLTGRYTVTEWSNNPAHITRFLLTDIRFGRIPDQRIDDEWVIKTAQDCDKIIEDRTNDEVIVLPGNVAESYGDGYRRFRSAGRVTPYRIMRDQLNLDTPPEFEEPQIQWFDPFQTYPFSAPHSVLRQKYTFNGAVQEKTTVLDLLNNKVFPVFKGYINYGFNGLIQIKNRQKADNGYVRQNTKYLDTKIPISNISPWKGVYDGYLLIGVALETAEIREVTNFEYSTACNAMPISVETTDGIIATCSDTLEGGSSEAPAVGFIDIDPDSEIIPGASITVSFNAGDDLFTVVYSTDGIEDVPCLVTMLIAFMNANLQFQEYLSAYINPSNPNRIYIRCESGYLNLDSPMEYEHFESEEVLRVQAVFENCGDLTHNTSARFDNILQDSFSWNNDEVEDINAVEASYISAIDDFHLTKILPRAAWDTIDLEGELAKESLDLTFADNYWQAAYLAKGFAIDRIDGNLFFSFKTGIAACRLELGDVIALRHDSGDGVLNYVPVWVNKLSFSMNNFTTNIGCKLYLSAAFDLRVQPIDVFLTTTLNPALNPNVPPETIGTNGGVGFGSEPVIVRPIHNYSGYGTSRYSPSGEDVV